MGEQEIINLLGQSGITGAIAYAGYKAVTKLYLDMREQHKEQLMESIKREDKLMDYLDKKNETDAKIANTLDNINDRLCEVEACVKKEDA